MKTAEDYVKLAAEQMTLADEATGPIEVRHEVRANFFARLALVAAICERGGTLFGHQAAQAEPAGMPELPGLPTDWATRRDVPLGTVKRS